MVQYIITTIHLLILGVIGFAVFRPVSIGTIPNSEFLQWRKLWLIITVVGFLSPMYMLFLLLVALVINFNVKNKPDQRIVAYFLLLCTLPQLEGYLRGIGGIQHLFAMSYTRLLAFVILIPLVINKPPHNLRGPKGNPFPSDKYVYAYVFINIFLNFRDGTFTDALRSGFYLIVDILIPYLAISRALVTRELIEKSFLALLLALATTAVVGIFESIKWWHIYQTVPFAHEILHASRKYDSRAGVMRANAIFTGPIIFGYAMAIAMGLYGYFYPKIKNKTRAYLGAGIIIVALYCSVSRGAWIGCAVVGLTYVWLSQDRFTKMFKIGMTGIATIPFIALTPFWQTFVNLLPFIGETRADTIDYRQQLFINAVAVIKRYPLFGTPKYLEEPEMVALTQGEGIVDTVNTYVQIGMANGLMGLLAFIGVFFGISFRIYRLLGKIPREQKELINVGRTILAVLAGILTIIATMSPIDFVTTLYWTFAAVGAAYIRIAKKAIYDGTTEVSIQNRLDAVNVFRKEQQEKHAANELNSAPTD